MFYHQRTITGQQYLFISHCRFVTHLKPKSVIRPLLGIFFYREHNFLLSFIFLLASCCSFVLDVARYAFELTINHLLNNLMKSVQDLMTDWS